jgi:hypothetical protein
VLVSAAVIIIILPVLFLSTELVIGACRQMFMLYPFKLACLISVTAWLIA